MKFLKSWDYNEYATKISEINQKDENLAQKLCTVFGVDTSPIEELKNIDVEKVVRRKNNQNRLKLYTDAEEILSKAENAAFDQKDLDELIKSEVSEIYLCNGKFKIPLDASNKIYIGVGDVVAIIDSEKLIDFDALNIHFKKISFDEKYKELPKSPETMYEFGKYYTGIGNYKKALYWYKKAFEYFKKAAAAGDSSAMFYLGVCYSNSEGVVQDYKKAIEWYEKAANVGNAKAMNHLGHCYYFGVRVCQNYQKAVEWYEKAANAGNVNAKAMNHLGVCYENGRGVERNFKRAFEWYEKAANIGDSAAMFHLGFFYEFGQCVDKDIEKAKYWYKKAATAGDPDSKKKLEELG